MADSNQFSKGIVPEFHIETAKGSVKKHQYIILGLCNPDVDSSSEESIWPFGGLQNYLASATELFMSSSDATDTGQAILVTGIDEDFNLVSRTYVTDGQTAVSVGIWYRVIQTRNIGFVVTDGGKLNGTLYIAESDTLVSGVPTTNSKVMHTIWFNTDSNRSPNVGYAAGFTVPTGHFALIRKIQFAAPNSNDVHFHTLIRPNNDFGIIRPWQDAAPFNMFRTTHTMEYEGIFIDQLWDVEFRADTINNNEEVTIIVELVLIEKD